MRAILIDVFNKKIREIDLPTGVNDFNKEVRVLLRSNAINIVHSNELLTVILDGSAVATGSPAFFSPLSDDLPIFGNALLIGKNPFREGFHDLFEMYKVEEIERGVTWCSELAAIYYRPIAMRYAFTNKK